MIPSVDATGSRAVNKIAEKALPKSMRGAVCAQYRTVKGKRYGPYWFRFWREAGVLRKEYVPAEDLATTFEACARHRWERRQGSVSRTAMQRQSRSVRALIAAYEALSSELERTR